MENKNDLLKRVIIIALIVSALFCLYIKIRYGICEDEEYFVSLIYNLSNNINGSILSKMWDIYQLTGTVFSPLLVLYREIFTNNEYLYLSLRILSVFLAVCISYYFYVFCTKELKINKYLSIIISIVYLLSAPKLAYNIDNSFQLMIYFTIFSCEMFKYIQYNKRKNLIIAAIFYCLSILAYVTLIFSLPFILIVIYKFNNREKTKTLTSFICVCLAMLLLFVFLYFGRQDLSINNIFYVIKHIVADNSYKLNIFEKIIYDIKRFSIAFVIFYIPIFLIYKYYLKIADVEGLIFRTCVSANTLINLTIILLTFTGIIDLSILTLMVRIIPIFVIFILKLKNDNFNIINYLYLILLIVCYCSTDQYIDSQARYIIPSILLSFGYLENKNLLFNFKEKTVSVIVIVIFSIYASGIYIPLDMNKTATLFYKFSTTDVPCFKGIYIDEDRKLDYEDLFNLDIKNEKVTIISDYIRGGWYIVNNNEIIAPYTETTRTPDEKWSDYFEYNKVDNCHILIHKKYFSSFNEFAEINEFGKYLQQNYKIEIKNYGNRFIDYYISKK